MTANGWHTPPQAAVESGWVARLFQSESSTPEYQQLKFSLHQAKQAVQTLINAGFGNRLHVILNRTPQRPDVTAEELERILGLPIDTMLPNDYYALYDAFCKGKLLPPGSHLSRQLSSFAMRLAGAPVGKGKRRFGLFG